MGDVKDKIILFLKSTKRPGIDNLIDYYVGKQIH